jgi:hypothetical protein
LGLFAEQGISIQKTFTFKALSTEEANDKKWSTFERGIFIFFFQLNFYPCGEANMITCEISEVQGPCLN